MFEKFSNRKPKMKRAKTGKELRREARKFKFDNRDME